eukprot:TRINITY_DN27659_c0_g1_i1.p1 TRINITY_DN27659_c0_g1~~TRINITY_DN27659_c0_g1_i1.p1  ORF type:complete len:719 (-),score=89.31 TRINITY_DN27659_c0_g1_i1:177-2333(-)
MDLRPVQACSRPRRLSIRLDVSALENGCFDLANAISRANEAHVNTTGSSSSDGATQLHPEHNSQPERPANSRNILVEIDAPEPSCADQNAPFAGWDSMLSFSTCVAQHAAALARSGTTVNRVVVTIHGDESESTCQIFSNVKARIRGSAKVAGMYQGLQHLRSRVRRLPGHLRQAALQGVGVSNAVVAGLSQSAGTAIKVVARVHGGLHHLKWATGRGCVLLVTLCRRVHSLKPRAPKHMRHVRAAMHRLKSQASVVGKQMPSMPLQHARQALKMAGSGAAVSASIAEASMKRLARLAGREEQIDHAEGLAKRARRELQVGGCRTSGESDEVLPLQELNSEISVHDGVAATAAKNMQQARADPAMWMKGAANVVQNGSIVGMRLAKKGADGIRKTSRGIATTVNKAGRRMPNVKRRLQHKLVEFASGAHVSLHRGALKGAELASSMASVATREWAKVMGMVQIRRQDDLGLEEQLQRNRDEQICAICCNTVSTNRAVRLECRHGWYCDTCMLRYSETQLADGALQVTCPECRSPIEEHILRGIVPHKVIDRLLEQSLRQAVAASGDLFACPTPDCPMRVALSVDGKSYLHCQLCSKTSCLRCGVQPYHEGATCESTCGTTKTQASSDDSERSLLQWMAETGTKQCPTCRMAVSKESLHNQGTQRSECHKMWCRNCGTRFCFKCLTVLTRSHTCGCTNAKHSFVNPHTGRLVKDVRSKG